MEVPESPRKFSMEVPVDSKARRLLHRTFFIAISVLLLGALPGFASPQVGGVGTTERVSVASDGTEADAGLSGGEVPPPAISADGRYIAFESLATNLVRGDTNGVLDVFLHDRLTGETTRVSVSTDGVEGDSDSVAPSISADGRYVAFESTAVNLADGDYAPWPDVFVHDRQTGETTRVSVASDGSPGNRGSYHPSISADGRYVAFWSAATNIVADDTTDSWDVFVHDRVTGETTRVSVASDGSEANHWSQKPSISSDGRFVAFESAASNFDSDDDGSDWDIFVHDRVTGETTCITRCGSLDGPSTGASLSADGAFVTFRSGDRYLVGNDTNAVPDVFVHDRLTGETTRVSVSTDGVEGDNTSWTAAVSADGRYVAFWSEADNLVRSDTNGQPDVFVRDREAQPAPTSTPSPTPTPEPPDCTPSDPRWNEQWDMHAIDLVGALSQFAACQPDPVDVAVIDTGVTLDHPDLAGRISSAITVIGDSAADTDGHGTFIAGIIGANHDDQFVAGILPSVRLRIYRFAEEGLSVPRSMRDFRTWADTTSDLAFLIRLAVDDGAEVINISYAVAWDQERINDFARRPCFPPDLRRCGEGEIRLAVEYAAARGAVIVAGSGNSGNDQLWFPAAYAATYTNVIAVAATTPAGGLAPESSTGTHVTIAAPGGLDPCVDGADDCIVGLDTNGGADVEGHGTSFAAPHVTGTVALMISANPNLTPSEIREIIQSTASPFTSVPGRNAGAGIINASAAVEEVRRRFQSGE